MKVGPDGKITDMGVSINDFTKKLTVPKNKRDKEQKKLFSQKPVLSINKLKTYFPIKGGFWTKNWLCKGC